MAILAGVIGIGISAFYFGFVEDQMVRLNGMFYGFILIFSGKWLEEGTRER